MNRKIIIYPILILILVYFGSYILFRQISIEVWEKDKKEYVIFPENKIFYYLFRPLVLTDGKLTGMRFHIGQHR